MKSTLDQRNWQALIEERILQFKSIRDSSINDIYFAVKWLTIKWITMNLDWMYFNVSKIIFCNMQTFCFMVILSNTAPLFFPHFLFKSILMICFSRTNWYLSLCNYTLLIRIHITTNLYLSNHHICIFQFWLP